MAATIALFNSSAAARVLALHRKTAPSITRGALIHRRSFVSEPSSSSSSSSSPAAANAAARHHDDDDDDEENESSHTTAIPRRAALTAAAAGLFLGVSPQPASAALSPAASLAKLAAQEPDAENAVEVWDEVMNLAAASGELATPTGGAWSAARGDCLANLGRWSDAEAAYAVAIEAGSLVSHTQSNNKPFKTSQRIYVISFPTNEDATPRLYLLGQADACLESRANTNEKAGE